MKIDYTLLLLKPSGVTGSTPACYIEVFLLLNSKAKVLISLSQWPRGLRRRSAAARLPRLWVRNPPGAHGRLSVVFVV